MKWTAVGVPLVWWAMVVGGAECVSVALLLLPPQQPPRYAEMCHVTEFYATSGVVAEVIVVWNDDTAASQQPHHCGHEEFQARVTVLPLSSFRYEVVLARIAEGHLLHVEGYVEIPVDGLRFALEHAVYKDTVVGFHTTEAPSFSIASVVLWIPYGARTRLTPHGRAFLTDHLQCADVVWSTLSEQQSVVNVPGEVFGDTVPGDRVWRQLNALRLAWCLREMKQILGPNVLEGHEGVTHVLNGSLHPWTKFRIAPWYADRVRKRLQQHRVEVLLPGGTTQEVVTVVIYETSNPFILHHVVQSFAAIPLVARIVIVWDSSDFAPPSSLFFRTRVPVDVVSAGPLGACAVFDLLHIKAHTEAVFYASLGLEIGVNDLLSAIQVWIRHEKDPLVGFFAMSSTPPTTYLRYGFLFHRDRLNNFADPSFASLRQSTRGDRSLTELAFQLASSHNSTHFPIVLQHTTVHLSKPHFMKEKERVAAANLTDLAAMMRALYHSPVSIQGIPEGDPPVFSITPEYGQVQLAAFRNLLQKQIPEEVKEVISPSCKDEIPPPSFSIIMSTYNHAKFVGEAIRSVLWQSYDQWELIVVDDGSTDETGEIIRHIVDAHKDWDIQVITKNNTGLSDSRNVGIAASQHPWVLMLDSDDSLPPDALRHAARAIMEDEYVDIVSGCILYFSEGARNMTYCAGRDGFSLLSQIHFRNHIHVSSVIRKTCLLAAGGFEESLPWGMEDYSLWIGCVARGARVRFLPHIMLYYRRTTDSMYARMADKYDLTKMMVRTLHPNVYSVSELLEALSWIAKNTTQVTIEKLLEKIQKLGLHRAAKAHFWLGLCFMEENRLKDAREHMVQAAMQAAPRDWQPFFVLAEIAEKMGELEEALQLMERVSVFAQSDPLTTRTERIALKLLSRDNNDDKRRPSHSY